MRLAETKALYAIIVLALGLSMMVSAVSCTSWEGLKAETKDNVITLEAANAKDGSYSSATIVVEEGESLAIDDSNMEGLVFVCLYKGVYESVSYDDDWENLLFVGSEGDDPNYGLVEPGEWTVGFFVFEQEEESKSVANGRLTVSTIPYAEAQEQLDEFYGNIYAQVSTVKEAEELVGYDIDVPETIEGLPIALIIVEKEPRITSISYFNKDNPMEVDIVKAPKDSGFTGYEEECERTEVVDGVKLYMNDDRVVLANWESDGFYFSIYFYLDKGLPQQDAMSIIGEIH